jgi:hypothetical protein
MALSKALSCHVVMQCRNTKCRYAECRYADCRGAQNMYFIITIILMLNAYNETFKL